MAMSDSRMYTFPLITDSGKDWGHAFALRWLGSKVAKTKCQTLTPSPYCTHGSPDPFRSRVSYCRPPLPSTRSSIFQKRQLRTKSVVGLWSAPNPHIHSLLHSIRAQDKAPRGATSCLCSVRTSIPCPRGSHTSFQRCSLWRHDRVKC